MIKLLNKFKRKISIMCLWSLIILSGLILSSKVAYATTVIDVTNLVEGASDSHICADFKVTAYDKLNHWTKCSKCDAVLSLGIPHSYGKTQHPSGFNEEHDCSPCNESLPMSYKQCSVCYYKHKFDRRECTLSNYKSVEDKAHHIRTCLNTEHYGATVDDEICTDTYNRELGCIDGENGKAGTSGDCTKCNRHIGGFDHSTGGNIAEKGKKVSYNPAEIADKSTDGGKTVSGGGQIICMMCGLPYGNVNYTITYDSTFIRIVNCQYESNDHGCRLYNNIKLLETKNVDGKDRVVDAISCSGIPDNLFYANVLNQRTINGGKDFEIKLECHFDKSIGSMKACEVHIPLKLELSRANSDLKPWIHIPMGFSTDVSAPTCREVKFMGSNKTVNVGGINWHTTGKVNSTWHDDYSSSLNFKLLNEEREEVTANWILHDTYDKDNGIFKKELDILDAEIKGTKTYILQAQDPNGNLTEQSIKVSNLDSKDPDIKSSEATDTSWTRSKTWYAQATDEGSGGVEISFNNNLDYESASNYIDGSTRFTRIFEFKGDVTGFKTAVINYKDACGNVSSRKLKIYNLDNTNPTITNVIQRVDDSGTTLNVIANDYCSEIKKYGSGIADYGISRTNNVDDIEWVRKNHNIITVNKGGTHYIWVKDNVGNISNPWPIDVKVKVTITCKLGNADRWEDGTKGDKIFRVTPGEYETLPKATKKGYTHSSYNKNKGDCELNGLEVKAGYTDSTVTAVLIPNKYNIEYDKGLTNN